MSYITLAQSAADWALSKIGCAYSQVKRTQQDISLYSGKVCGVACYNSACTLRLENLPHMEQPDHRRARQSAC